MYWYTFIDYLESEWKWLQFFVNLTITSFIAAGRPAQVICKERTSFNLYFIDPRSVHIFCGKNKTYFTNHFFPWFRLKVTGKMAWPKKNNKFVSKLKGALWLIFIFLLISFLLENYVDTEKINALLSLLDADRLVGKFSYLIKTSTIN